MKAILITLLWTLSCFAQNHKYECRKDNNHTIHIVTIDPAKYKTVFIKSHDQVFGKETVESMAKRTGAAIAINGGFLKAVKMKMALTAEQWCWMGKFWASDLFYKHA